MSITKKEVELLDLCINSGANLFFETTPQNRLEPIISQKILQDVKNSKIISNLKSSIYKDSDSASNLKELCAAIKQFDGCALKRTAINTVICDGQIDAKIMLIGEAPGVSEDENGIPFCGQSGKLLDNIMKSIGLSREINIFITNTVFWRPPGNRRPTSEEILLCKPFLDRMITLLSPKLIILVGNTAIESLLGLKGISMHAIRNQKLHYGNSCLVQVIFHPSYLLRQPKQKKEMWFDMLKIKEIIVKNSIF